jgi:hypothetical protein
LTASSAFFMVPRMNGRLAQICTIREIIR